EDRVLEARTILGELERRHPGEFSEAQVRTLQRRMRDWRAVHGPEREVFFEQVHVPGREAALDFTHATELGVTILGKVLEHLLFVCTLSFSGWTWIAIAFGETFEALVSGLQGALYDLGGAPGSRTARQPVGGDARASTLRRASTHRAVARRARPLRSA